MKTQLTCLFLLVGLISATAQRRTIDVDNFTKISFAIPGTLYLTQGSDEKVEVESNDEAFERLEFKMEGSKLKIQSKRNSWRNWNGNSKVNVYVTMKNIEGVSVGGSGSVLGQNKFETSDLYLSVSGSGSMDIKTNSEDVDLSVSGSGKISLNGSADKADVSISGSGRVKAEDFEVNACEASISGSGSCYITAIKEIDARISGSGNVYYGGNPDRVISNSSGSGKVRKL
ncbi:MAG: DUF2807 domain-containing protein [Cytophagales bacterium]|nr:DUF2807 domain-containing protein [Cytophagales bacterium]